jgi:hypothetical protein
MTETSLSDDAGGDPTNLIYLQEQCGADRRQWHRRRHLQMSDRGRYPVFLIPAF